MIASRYIQADPIGLLGGLNTYGYAYQRPLKFVDPKGEVGLLLGACMAIIAGDLAYAWYGIAQIPQDTEREKEIKDRMEEIRQILDDPNSDCPLPEQARLIQEWDKLNLELGRSKIGGVASTAGVATAVALTAAVCGAAVFI